MLANTRSAKKRVRQTAHRAAQNKAVKSRFRTAIRRFKEALAEGDGGRIKAAFSQAASLLDKAAKIGIIHRNTAGRTKSRLAKEWTKTKGA